jgi:hypothetical protein
MNLGCKTSFLTFAGALILTFCVPAVGQESADLISSDQAAGAASPLKASASADDNWHFAISPYLWFAGVHGGGASLNYQVAGLLGYRIKPTAMLEAGWRYLDVNYRPSSSFVYDVAQSGLLLGVTFNLK